MVKQWVQPPINQKQIATWRFFVSVPSHKFYVLFVSLRLFIGILGESIEIQFLAIFYIDFNKGFNQI